MNVFVENLKAKGFARRVGLPQSFEKELTPYWKIIVEGPRSNGKYNCGLYLLDDDDECWLLYVTPGENKDGWTEEEVLTFIKEEEEIVE